MHLLTIPNQVSPFPSLPISPMFNFVSSKISPHYRTLQIKIICSKIPNPISNSSKQESMKVSYLINSCGLPPERAVKIAKYVDFESTKKPDAVLAFFKNLGFTQTQISKIIRQVPPILSFDPEKTLLPKVEFFSSIGLSRTEIISLIDASPLLLKRSLKKSLVPSFNRLIDLTQSHDKAINLIKWCPLILLEDPGVDNIQILLEIGVPEPKSKNPLEQNSVPTGGNFRRILEEIKEIGFDPSGMSFMWVIHALRSIKKCPNWEKKVELLKKWGWSEDDFLMAFKRCPNFMTASEDKIIRVMDFLVNTMGMEASDIAYRPTLLLRSFDKVIVPRCLVYQLLMEKGLYQKKRRMSLLSLLSLTENKFLEEVIETFDEDAPEIVKLYQEKVGIP